MSIEGEVMTNRRLNQVLDSIHVPCRDNGTRFCDRSRADRIHATIEQITPVWRRVHNGPLALLYRASSVPKPGGLLISAHIDSLYQRCHHRLNEDFWEGTFDNILPVGVLIDALSDNRFETEGVTIAFTGDEEFMSRGAIEAAQTMDRDGLRPSFVLVLDVTAEDDEEAGATIENCFPGNSGKFGPDDRIMGKRLSALAGNRLPVINDADPDESWRYRELGLPCASLCMPCVPLPGDERDVAAWMHDDQGFAVRADVPSCYQAALLALVAGITKAVK